MERCMFQIGEFSKITQVSIRMLRYYDQNNLLHPAYVDAESGYRLYTADQIDRLQKIVRYRDFGFGVKEIAELLKCKSADELSEMMHKQIEKTQEEIELARKRLIDLKSFLQDTEDKKETPGISIVLRSIPESHCLTLRRRARDYYCEADMWQEFMPFARGLENNPCFTLYHDLDYREEDVDIEVCVEAPDLFVLPSEAPVNGALSLRTIPGIVNAASFIVYGPYSNIAGAYKQFAYWIESHPEYRMAGASRQICHVSYGQTDDESKFVTEMLIPLEYTSL